MTRNHHADADFDSDLLQAIKIVGNRSISLCFQFSKIFFTFSEKSEIKILEHNSHGILIEFKKIPKTIEELCFAIKYHYIYITILDSSLIANAF